ncbi:MAG: tetratricopeptide repeat protein [Bacteroidota bacterium]
MAKISRNVFLALLLMFGGLSQPAAAQMPPENGDRVFAEAFKLHTDQLFEQANHAFDKFRRQYPQHINAPEALYYQAESSLVVGREEEAVHLFSQFQDLYPSHPLAFEARLALGKYYYAAGQHDKAINTLARVVQKNPPDEVAARALYWMGESALNLNNLAEAVGYFERAAIEYPETTTAPIALYAVAATQVRQENPEAAVRFFELLSARYPQSPYTQNLGLTLAEVYYELGDYRRSIDEVKRRLPNLSGPALDRANFLLAESHNQLRESDQAIVYYRRFTENNADSPFYRNALYGLAWNYHSEGAYQWAAEHFGQVLQQRQKDELAANAAYYRAVNTKLAGQPFEALNMYKDAAAQYPKNEISDQIMFELGMTAYELRRWEEARDAFTRVINEFPASNRRGQAFFRRGSSFIALGDFDAALSNFDRAIALDAAPASLKQEVIFQKAWLQYRSGNYSASAPAFMELFQKNASTEVGGEALFWAAESYHQLGDLLRASQLFRQYLRGYSGGKQADAAHYALGWTHFKQGNYESAIGEFRQFLSQYRNVDEFVPYRTDALLRMADSYYALKRYPEAIQTYARIGGEDGNDYALYQVGQAYYNAGEGFEAITTFRRLLRDFPESDWVEESQYNLGYLYFQNQNYQEAIGEYQKLIRDYPRDPLAAKAQYGIGDAQFNAGNMEEAVESYRTVLQQYPNSPFSSDAAAGIQTALIVLGDEERASEIIESFAGDSNSNALADEMRFRQAEVKYQTGQIDEALLDFQRFVRNSENTQLLPDAYFYLGSIFSERNRPQEAEAYLKRIVTRHPQSPRNADATRKLGDLLLAQNRSQEALDTFQSLEGLQADNPQVVGEARYGQAKALLQLGRQAEAERLLNELTQAGGDPSQLGPVQLGLARVYESEGRTQDAVNMYRNVVDQNLDATGAEALYRLGQLLVNQGQDRAALEELGRMSVLYAGYSDWVAQGYLAQATAFRNLGQRGDALQLYNRIIEEYSGTTFADLAAKEKASL